MIILKFNWIRLIRFTKAYRIKSNRSETFICI